MAKELFNEAELYLLRQWQSARLMEESMETIRVKYDSLFQKTVDAFRARHEELNNPQVYVKQFWDTGYAGVGRKAWCSGNYNPGFYLYNLRLEILSDETQDAPYAYIWLGSAKKTDADLAAARERIRLAASKLLTKEELQRCKMDDPDKGCPLYYYLPESRNDLLNMLTMGDGQHFADCMTAHLELLARFTPILDEVLLKGARARG
jgi:hypothetical protein